MASKHIAWAFEQAPQNARDHVVLLALADSADDNGVVANVPQWQLAIKTNSTERNLRQCVDRLASEGYLSIFQRINAAHKRKQTNIYALACENSALQLQTMQQIANRENAEIEPVIKENLDTTARQQREAERQAKLEKATGHMDPLAIKAIGSGDPLAPKTTGSNDPMDSQATGHIDPLELSPATQGIEENKPEVSEQETSSHGIKRSSPIHTYINNKYIDRNKYTDDTAAKRSDRGRFKKHQIPTNWMPSEALIDRILSMNDNKGEKYQLEIVMELVPEFVTYWSETGQARPGWDRTFLSHVQRSYRQLAMARNANGAGTTLTPFNNQATPNQNHNGVTGNYERHPNHNQASRGKGQFFPRRPTGADIHADALERFFNDFE